MTDKPQNDTRRRVPADVQAHQRDKFVREHNERERAKSDAKTAKLRALRLAKEAADKEAEQKREAEKAARDAESPRRKRVIRY
jgi:hypothetical protein